MTAVPAAAEVGDLAYQGCITGELESGPPPGGFGQCAALPSAADLPAKKKRR